MTQLSTSVGIILLITFFFFSFGFLVDDFEQNYVDTNISQTSKFNQSSIDNFSDAEFIEEEMRPIKEGFDDIATDSGFFDRIQDLAVVVPIAIIKVPGVILALITRGVTRMIQVLNILGIPVEVIAMVGVGLFVWILFKLVAFWRRTPV